jgi:hypothetical protein
MKWEEGEGRELSQGEEGNAILRVLRYTATGIAALPLLDPTDRAGWHASPYRVRSDEYAAAMAADNKE